MMRFVDDFIVSLEGRLLRGTSENEHARNELRIAQLRRIMSISRLLMFANIINAFILTFALLAKGVGYSIVAWAAIVVVLAMAGLRKASSLKWDFSKKSISVGAIRSLAVKSFILGLTWGSAPLLFLFHAGSEPDVHVVAILAGMLGGGATALSFLPSVMFAYMIGIGLPSATVLILDSSISSLSLLGLMCVFSLVLYKVTFMFARAFAHAVAREWQVREQAETIDVLLKEYQSGGRDWIWETDEFGLLVRGAEEFSNSMKMQDAETFQSSVISLCLKTYGWHGTRLLARLMRERKAINALTIELRDGQDGAPYWFVVNGKPLFDRAGQFTGYRGVASNVTHEITQRERVEKLANYDQMTGLYNRASFIKRVESKLDDYGRPKQEFAVFYLDLDGFKAVNDGKGHAAGDELLKQVGKRLLEFVGSEDCLARVGGDEFSMIISKVDEADERASAIVQSLSEPFQIDGFSLHIGCSIGIVESRLQETSPSVLMNRADIALYHAKADGRSRFCRFVPSMEEQARSDLALRDALVTALRKDEIGIVFQPIFDAQTQRLASFEALARWHHPEFGSVSPSIFVPIAEEAGLINLLGKAVLTKACQSATLWPEAINIAVNISVPHFRSGQIIDDVRVVLAETGIDASRLELELTEQVMADDADNILDHIQALQAMGVSVALDDFGTGYSSLSYLLRFPFNKLKVDQAFVAQAQTDKRVLGVLNTMIALADHLSLETTVEGVETPDQHEIVSSIGCDFVQGFFYSKPLDIEDVGAAIAKDLALISGNQKRALVDKVAHGHKQRA